MRTIRRGMVALLVTVGWLVIPANADAYGNCVAMTTHVYRDGGLEGLNVVATAEAQFVWMGDTQCDISMYDTWIELELVLDMPGGSDSDYGYAAYYDVATATASGTIDSSGWYIATQWVDVYGECRYGCQYVTSDVDQDSFAVPTPTMQLDGPVNPQLYDSYWISASVDPWYLAEAIQWQGCTPDEQNHSNCLFTANSLGQNVVTASIWGYVIEQWTMNVVP
jgi:hypothetical protein